MIHDREIADVATALGIGHMQAYRHLQARNMLKRSSGRRQSLFDFEKYANVRDATHNFNGSEN